jgi:hypothetical protein
MNRLVLSISLLLSTAASAQTIDLPRPSPNAKVSQTVGLTDISVDYSSPAVRGRKIWGGVVPYGQVWRAGANAATKVTFSKDVSIGGTAVPTGSYALLVIPNAKGPWTVILSKDPNASQFAYKKEDDLLRVDVKPQPAPMRERLAYAVEDFTNDAAYLTLNWEKEQLRVPVKLNTETQVSAVLKGLEENAWMPYNQAARYELEQKKDYDAGLKLVDQSLSIKEDWLNVWTKAQLLAAKGNFKQAYPLAQKANELGQKAQQGRFFFAEDVKKALSDWKTKL